MQRPVKKILFNTGVTSDTTNNVLEYVVAQAKKPDKKCMIVTPNPEMIVYADSHPDFRDILNKADLALCDGVGLLLASKIVGKPIKERITGVDFVKNLCEKSVENGLSIGFLGGRQNVAEETSKCLRQMYPGLKVVFAAEEWSEGAAKLQSGKAAKTQNNAATLPLGKSAFHIDILFVAFGFPKQEEWIAKHLPDIPVTVAMGVGGAFDYLSGRVPRAPRLIRAMGMEWLYRLVRQPWRWKRQLALIKFIGLAIRQARKVQ